MDEILSLERMRDVLQDRNLKAVAAGSGVNYRTVRDIRNGHFLREFKHREMQALSAYLLKPVK